MRRIGKLIAQYKSRGDQVDLPGIEAMRRSAREVALVDGLPAFVAYDWTELASESLRREDVPRLFPGDSLMEFIEAEAITSQSSSLTGTNTIPARSEWIVDLRSAVRSADHREALQRIVDDDDAPPALRLIANFGITLRLRTSRPGKGHSIRATANTILMLATCLGHDLESDDLAKLAPADRRKIYVEAINAQPARKRPDAVQAVREFDLFLVAKFAGTLPIQRNSLPWFRKPPAFDPNIVTHSEYNSVLMHIEDRWPVTRSERRKRITILVVALAFRCMLRRGELRGLRIEDVLLLVENPFSGDPELHLRHRKEDPLKTLAAERRIPLQLLSDDELRMLKDWLQARLSEGAKAKDYFFAIPKEHMDRIPRTLFDSLNKRLRKLTPYAAGGKGIHLHHCRHAGGTWLFVGMLLADSLRRRQLFPGLKDSHDWMEQNGYRLWDLFCGNQLPSKRLPYVVAKVCGQASFDTTASSYINIFPWLVAHDSDATNPDQRDLLRIACEASPKQFRDWLRKGGPHHVAVQVLIGKGLGAKLRNNSSANTGIDSDAATDMDWLNAIWRKLASRRKGEIKASIETDMARIFERADWLANQETRNHHPRHPVERTPGGGPSADKSTKSVAPLQPPQSKNDVSPSLLRLLRDRAVADGAALAEALAIFGRFHERDGFVAFRSIDQIELADRYIKLLGKLGFGLREMDVVCGVTDGKSRVLREWRDQFRAKGHKGLRIRPCPSGGSYSPRGSLWVRPSLDALRARKTGPSCFRYLMAMGFIAYGEIPKPATVARSPATV
jgi:integrase